MRKRLLWPALVALCAGCTMFVPSVPEPAPNKVASAEPAQAAKENFLRQASQCLERGDEEGAASRLTAYVEANPNHALIRAHLAELLYRQNRRSDAKREFTTYVELAQEQGEPADRHMLLSHTRLAEIAREEGDDFSEHLHRGIGLWLLASQVQKLPEPGDDAPEPQQLLFKSVRELKRAAAARPDDARPHWYLFEVWSALRQQHPARTSLNRARELAVTSDLTDAERQAIARSR